MIHQMKRKHLANNKTMLDRANKVQDEKKVETKKRSRKVLRFESARFGRLMKIGNEFVILNTYNKAGIRIGSQIKGLRSSSD